MNAQPNQFFSSLPKRINCGITTRNAPLWPRLAACVVSVAAGILIVCLVGGVL